MIVYNVRLRPDAQPPVNPPASAPAQMRFVAGCPHDRTRPVWWRTSERGQSVPLCDCQEQPC